METAMETGKVMGKVMGKVAKDWWAGSAVEWALIPEAAQSHCQAKEPHQRSHLRHTQRWSRR